MQAAHMQAKKFYPIKKQFNGNISLRDSNNSSIMQGNTSNALSHSEILRESAFSKNEFYIRLQSKLTDNQLDKFYSLRRQTPEDSESNKQIESNTSLQQWKRQLSINLITSMANGKGTVGISNDRVRIQKMDNISDKKKQQHVSLQDIQQEAQRKETKGIGESQKEQQKNNKTLRKVASCKVNFQHCREGGEQILENNDYNNSSKKLVYPLRNQVIPTLEVISNHFDLSQRQANIDSNKTPSLLLPQNTNSTQCTINNHSSAQRILYLDSGDDSGKSRFYSKQLPSFQGKDTNQLDTYITEREIKSKWLEYSSKEILQGISEEVNLELRSQKSEEISQQQHKQQFEDGEYEEEDGYLKNQHIEQNLKGVQQLTHKNKIMKIHEGSENNDFVKEQRQSCEWNRDKIIDSLADKEEIPEQQQQQQQEQQGVLEMISLPKKQRSSYQIPKAVINALQRQSSLGKSRDSYQVGKSNLPYQKKQSMKEEEKESSSSSSSLSPSLLEDQDKLITELRKQVYGIGVDIETEDYDIGETKALFNFTENAAKKQRNISNMTPTSAAGQQLNQLNSLDDSSLIRKSRQFQFHEGLLESAKRSKRFYQQQETMDRKFQQFLIQTFVKKPPAPNQEQQLKRGSAFYKASPKNSCSPKNGGSPKNNRNITVVEAQKKLQFDIPSKTLPSNNINNLQSKTDSSPQNFTQYIVTINPPQQHHSEASNESSNLLTKEKAHIFQFTSSPGKNNKKDKAILSKIEQISSSSVSYSSSPSSSSTSSSESDIDSLYSLENLEHISSSEDEDVELDFKGRMNASSFICQSNRQNKYSKVNYGLIANFTPPIQRKRSSSNKQTKFCQSFINENLQNINHNNINNSYEFRRSFVFVRNYIINYFSHQQQPLGIRKNESLLATAKKIEYLVETDSLLKEKRLSHTKTEDFAMKNLHYQCEIASSFDEVILFNRVLEHTFCMKSVKYFSTKKKLPLSKFSLPRASIEFQENNNITSNKEISNPYKIKQSLADIAQKIETLLDHSLLPSCQSISSDSQFLESQQISSGDTSPSAATSLGAVFPCSSPFLQDTETYEDESFNNMNLFPGCSLKAISFLILNESCSLLHQIKETIPPIQSSLHEDFVKLVLGTGMKINDSHMSNMLSKRKMISEKYSQINNLLEINKSSSNTSQKQFQEYFKDIDHFEGGFEDSICFKSEICAIFSKAKLMKEQRQQQQNCEKAKIQLKPADKSAVSSVKIKTSIEKSSKLVRQQSQMKIFNKSTTTTRDLSEITPTPTKINNNTNQSIIANIKKRIRRGSFSRYVNDSLSVEYDSIRSKSLDKKEHIKDSFNDPASGWLTHKSQFNKSPCHKEPQENNGSNNDQQIITSPQEQDLNSSAIGRKQQRYQQIQQQSTLSYGNASFLHPQHALKNSKSLTLTAKNIVNPVPLEQSPKLQPAVPKIAFPTKKNSLLKSQNSIGLNSSFVSPLSWTNSLDNMDKKSLLVRSNKISLNKKCKLSPELQLFHAIQDNRLNELDDIIQKYSLLQFKKRDEEGNTFLMVAARVGNIGIVKEILFRASALLNLQNNNGDTALHIALAYQNSEVVDFLLLCKIDQSIVNNQNKIAWDLGHLQ